MPPLPHAMLQLFDTHFTLYSTTLRWGGVGGGFEA